MKEPEVLVATWDDGLFAVTGDKRVQEFANQPVRGLVSDGDGGALAIVGGRSLCRRTASVQWTTLATSDADLSCCVSVRDTIYVGTDDARMLRLSNESDELVALTGFDIVAGRDAWYAGSAIVNGQRLGPPLGVRSVAANCNGSVLFANVHVGGIPRSVDSGRTWQPTIDINSDVHEVSAHPTDPEIVAAASALGLCISYDSGATWTIESAGLHATHCSAVAFIGDDILVSASTGPFAAQGRVYRRSLKTGAPLVAVEGGLPEWMEGKVDTGGITANGSSAAVIDWGGNLYVSGDLGQSWLCRRKGLPSSSGILIF